MAAASLHARITDVDLSSTAAHSTLRMAISGAGQQLAVERDGDLTRVSLKRTDLGRAFSAGDRFQWFWTPTPGGTEPRRAHCPEALWIERHHGEVSVSLRLPADISVEPRYEGSAIVLVFRPPRAPTAAALRHEPETTPLPQRLETGVEEHPPASAPAALPVPPPVVAATTTPREETPAPPAPGESNPSSTPDVVTQLLATLSGSEPAASSPSAEATGRITVAGELDEDGLYRRLFPHDAPAASEPSPADAPEARADRAIQFGFLTFEPTLRIAYLDATASLLDDETGEARDRYFELRPGLGVGTRLWQGRFRADYEPSLRSFGRSSATQSTSHRAGASLDLAPGRRVQVVVRDAWAAGVLEVREVDPGGEYFFDLQRFWRNTAGVTARHEVAPRWRLEAGGRFSQVRFRTPGAFFDHDTRTLDLGVDYELSEDLHTSLTYGHERVPRSAERPQAESTANDVRALIAGSVSPRMSTQLALGYREQRHPFAGEGGRKYGGLVARGALTRTLGLASSVGLSGTRAVLLSAFEDNGFYVTNQLQTDAIVRLPYGLFLDGSVGYRWNDYQTVAGPIGAPRDDAIFDWGLGLRRSLDWGSIGASYRRQQRHSNIDRFDTSTDRLILQLDFDVLRATGLR